MKVTISRKRNPTRSDQFFGDKLREKDQLEIVGVTVDRKLTWTNHVCNVIARTGQ